MKPLSTLPATFIALTILTGSGCMSAKISAENSARLARSRAAGSAPAERMMIKNAYQNLTVKDVDKTAKNVEILVKESEGYVQGSSLNSECRATFTIKVPAAKLDFVLDNIAALGRETSRRVSAEDVTEQVIDIEARVNSKKALRDRLRKLLEKAKDVQDVLEIEKELERTQAEIDSMEGRLNSLKKRAAMSTIHLTVTRKRTPGPVGALLKATGWFIEKLFVL